jgi:hypothetical protein
MFFMTLRHADGQQAPAVGGRRRHRGVEEHAERANAAGWSSGTTV